MAETNDPVANPLGALQQMALSGAQQSDAYRQQQQDAYNTQLSRFEGIARQPETEAGKWGAIAKGLSSVAPVQGNFGAMLANMGASYGDYQQKAQQDRIAAEQAITKMRGDELRALESRNQTSQYIKALSGGAKSSVPQVKVVDGKLVEYDPITREARPLTGTPEQLRSKMWSKFYEAAVANETPDPEKYADIQWQQYAEKLGYGTGTPTAAPIATPAAAPSDTPAATDDRIVESAPGAKFDFDTAGMSPKDKLEIRRIIERYKANPNEGTKAAVAKKLKKLWNGVPAEAAQPTEEKPAPQSSLTYVDKVKRAEDTARAHKLGDAAAEKELDAPKETAAAQNAIAGLDDFLAQIKFASGHPGLEKATGWRHHVPLYGSESSISGTDPAVFLGKLSELKSKALIEKLQEIKALSKTGASGFGSLTEQEADRIIQGLANLDPSKLGPDDMKRELGNLQGRVDRMRQSIIKTTNQKYPGALTPPERTIVRKVELKGGRTGVEYSDGTREVLK